MIYIAFLPAALGHALYLMFAYKTAMKFKTFTYFIYIETTLFHT
jgi:hypothetical protein